MEVVLSVVAMLAMLLLVSRGTPRSRWLGIIAVTLAVIVMIVLMERGGGWPQSWVTR